MLLLAAALWPGLAIAQDSVVTRTLRSFPVDVPTHVEPVHSVLVHPGAAARRRGMAFSAGGGFGSRPEGGDAGRRALEGHLQLGLPWGFGLAGSVVEQEILKPGAEGLELRSELGLGVGKRFGSTELGFAWRHAFEEGAINTFDVSLMQGVGSYMRLFAGVRDIAERDAATPSYVLGIGLRPGVSWLGLHGAVEARGRFEEVHATGALRFAVADAVDVDLGVETGALAEASDLRALARLRIGLGVAGEYEAGMAAGIGTEPGSWLAAGRATWRSPSGRSVVSPAPVGLILDIAAVLNEAPGPGLFSGPAPGFAQHVASLLGALEDEAVKVLVLRIDSGLGWSQADDLRAVADRYRAAGRKVVAFLRSPNDAGVYLAMAADHVYVDPVGGMMLTGLYRPIRFFGPGLSRIGVQFQAVRHAEYKSFPEQLTGGHPSAQFLEAENRLLDVFEAYLLGAIGARLRADLQSARNVVDAGPLTAPEAVARGLADAELKPDDLEERLQKDLGMEDLSLRKYAYRRPRSPTGWGRAPRLALVVVAGNIVRGKSSFIPVLGMRNAGDKDVVKAIEAAAKGPYDGILLRVVSPGGDGLAAEAMARAVEKAAEKKPVVVSMGNVAASGGYLIASVEDVPIVASALTVTGSIGVFAIKPVIRTLTDRLGLPVTELRRGHRAGILSPNRLWTVDEQDALKDKLGHFYRGFVARVVKARGKSEGAIEPICRGRIWAGADARSNGLVDGIGGVSEAIATLSEKVGLDPDEPAELVRVGAAPGLLGRMFGGKQAALETGEDAAAAVAWARPLVELTGIGGAAFAMMVKHGEVLAWLPAGVGGAH